jgi:DNA repair exonuclease SbcCD ATPase subunit
MAMFRKTPRTREELTRVTAEIEKLREAMDRHEERTRSVAESLAAQPDTGGLVGRIDAVVEQIGALDARITSVSTELANQLNELGDDIESLQKRALDEPVADEVVSDLRDSQERLANEQARYQIAFRDDLAKLAEQLRRPGR